MPNDTSSKLQKGELRFTILGTRGSMTTASPEMMRYGGNTTSYLFETEEEAIIIDAGTGIMNLPDVGEKRLSLIITHTHIDHILGLPMLLGSLRNRNITVYGEIRGGYTIRQQLERYLSIPLWPVSIDDYDVTVDFVNIAEGVSFSIGGVRIDTMPSNHPGGSTIFKLLYGGKVVTVATDFEHSPEASEGLISFARGSDMMLYDAQYTPDEYEQCRGFGHSTYEQAVIIQKKADIKEMLLVHHAPGHTDAFLDDLQCRLEAEGCKNISFAREGFKTVI